MNLWRLLAKAVRAIVPSGPLTGGWQLWSRFPVSPNVIREPLSGAWQRNLACSEQTLLAFSGVFACVSIIAGDLAKLPIRVYRVKDSGEREEARTHWAYRLFRRPNAYQTRFDFIQQFMTSTLLTGNAYAWFDRDERNAPNAMHVLDPRRVKHTNVPDSDDFFYIYSPGGDATPRVYDTNELLHHRIFTLAHPLAGVTPLFAAAQPTMTGLQIASNSQSFFGNMSRPSGIVTAPKGTSPDEMDLLKVQWEAAYSPGNGNLGRVALLSDDVKWQPLTMNAEDAQLIEQL